MAGNEPAIAMRVVPSVGSKEDNMAAILPILLASSQLLLAADRVPQLDVTPSCRAAANAAVMLNRSEERCARSEDEARAKLEQEWSQYNAQQQGHCVRLSALGGSPSYIELLTCLELDSAAKKLPDKHEVGARIEQ